MAAPWQVIHLHAEAPAKPALGAACNGCGVCCAYAPCPLGVLLSRRLRGACAALRWDAAGTHYRCGAIVAPAAVLPRGLGFLAPLLSGLAGRWISAGSGCDAALETGVAGVRRDMP